MKNFVCNNKIFHSFRAVLYTPFVNFIYVIFFSACQISNELQNITDLGCMAYHRPKLNTLCILKDILETKLKNLF